MSKFYNIPPTNHGWGYGYGFFSNYRICLEQLIDYEQSEFLKKDGFIPYIDWSGTTWVEGFNPFESSIIPIRQNPFDFWFDQNIPQQTDQIIQCKSGPRPDLIDHAKDYFDDKENLMKQKSIEKKYIKLKKSIEDKIDQIYNDNFKVHNVLGIMARGTEYNYHHPMYGIFGVEDYIKEINKIIEKQPDINKIFVVSEDSDYIEKISKAFSPNCYFMENVFRRTDETMEYMNRVHCWPNVSTKRPNHCRLLGEEVIIQTKLLGKCKYLFGRHSGVFAGAVLWSENLEKVFKI